MEKFSVFWDRILVKPSADLTKTKGGIFLTDLDWGDLKEGTIVGAGNGKKDDHGKITPLQVKIGDVIYFNKHDGVKIEVNSEEFLVMKEEDVYCVKDKA